MQENVGVWKYRLKRQEHYVYIDFTNKSDMDRVIKNRKYQQVDDFTVHFNKKSTIHAICIVYGRFSEEQDTKRAGWHSFTVIWSS